MSQPRSEHLFKIIVVGDVATGKTSLIKRYVHDVFSSNYKATIGVDFSLKGLTIDEHTHVKLQLWDIAGQERFGNMTRVFYKDAVGALVVYDMSRQQTFDGVKKWKADIDNKVQLADGKPIPCILIGNKSDVPTAVSRSVGEMDQYCSEMGFDAWYECSAKTNANVGPAMQGLVSAVMKRVGEVQRLTGGGEQQKREGVVSLNDSQANGKGKGKAKKEGCC
jgi:Ras-related protein Rab-32